MAERLGKERRAEVEREAWRLRQRGWSQARIAEELRVHQGTVARALGRVLQRSVDRLDAEARVQLCALVGQVEHAIDETMQGWERSKRPKKKAVKRTGAGRSGAGEATATEIHERDGDPAFISQFYRGVDAMRALLCLDERARPEPPAADGEVPTVRDVVAEALAADALYVPDADADATPGGGVPPLPLPIPTPDGATSP